MSIKRALQALLFAGEQSMADVILGNKSVTIREGHRDYTEGPVMLGCHILNWCRLGEIIEVVHTKVKDVHLIDIVNDGCNNTNELLEKLRKYYPHMTMDSDVTVVRFNVD